MKKTVYLTHPKIKRPRLVEAAKGSFRKYLKRSRRVPLPEGVDFWDFECKYGPTQRDSKPVHVAEVCGCIDAADAEKLDSFYIEAEAKPGYRTKRPRAPESDASEVTETEAATLDLAAPAPSPDSED